MNLIKKIDVIFVLLAGDLEKSQAGSIVFQQNFIKFVTLIQKIVIFAWYVFRHTHCTPVLLTVTPASVSFKSPSVKFKHRAS